MNHIQTFRFAVLITLLFGSFLNTLCFGERPNIVFFIVDDHKRDFYTFLPGEPHTGKMKGSVMPHLDRLAREGVVLSELHVPSPVCIPSRFTVLTGTYPSRAINDGFAAPSWRWGYPRVSQNTHVNEETKTIAHRLKEIGYRTGAVGKNHVIENESYVSLGVNVDLNDPAVKRKLRRNAESEKVAWRRAGFDYAESLYHNNVSANGPRELNPHNIDWIAQGALDFIDSTGDEPFFLYFAATTPHGPHGHWETGNRRATPNGMLKEAPQVLPSKQSIRERIQAKGFRKEDGYYWKLAGDNMWTDDALGAILDRLEERGQLKNTIVVYFNDHGVESGKTTIYQGGMKSMSVVFGPEKYVKGGRLVESLASSVDFGATIMNWAGGDMNRLDGKDLGPLLAGEVETVRDTVYGEMGTTRAVRKGNWKYIALREPEYLKNLPMEIRQNRIDEAKERMKHYGRKPFPNTADQPFAHIGYLPGGWDNTWSAMREHPHYFDADQLYDLASDPHEQVNLAGDPKYADVLAEMKRELSRYLKRFPGQFGEF